MNGKTLVWITLAALVSAGCKEKDGAADGGAMLEYSPAVNEVDVICLERQPFPMQILSNGKLSPASSSSLSFPSGGTIVRVNFENGDRVEKGDVIAELDSGEQKLALDAAEIALRRSELEYLDVLAGLGYPDEDTAPENVREVALVRSGLDASRNDYEKAALAYDATCLRAPISGTVANISQKTWDVTDGKPFCTVIDDSSFEVRFNILESEYPLVTRGQGVKVTPFGQGSASVLTGKVRTVNPSIDENGQIEVCATLSGSSRLLDGMNMKVTVDKFMDDMMVVPKSAVVVRDDLDVLFCYSGGKARWVYVNILGANSESYAVEANESRGASLEPGDTVIVSGNLNLADGSSVRLKE